MTKIPSIHSTFCRQTPFTPHDWFTLPLTRTTFFYFICNFFYFISTSHLNSILHGALCSTVHVHLYNTIHGPLCSSVHGSLCSSGSSFAQHCTCSFAQHCARSNIISKSILFKLSWNLLLVTTFMPCNFQCVKFSL